MILNETMTYVALYSYRAVVAARRMYFASISFSSSFRFCFRFRFGFVFAFAFVFAYEYNVSVSVRFVFWCGFGCDQNLIPVHVRITYCSSKNIPFHDNRFGLLRFHFASLPFRFASILCWLCSVFSPRFETPRDRCTWSTHPSLKSSLEPTIE